MSKHNVITSSEAAKMLNVSLRTVQLWVEKGALNAWKTPGGHRRITLESVHQLIQKNEMEIGIIKPILKLLIVEDDASQRELYARYLDKWNLPLEIEFAENGYQGMISIGKQAPNVLITDLMMPSMDGFEMIKSIRANAELKSTHIIAVTALSAEHTDVCKLASEGIAILHKPFLYDVLREMIEYQLSLFTDNPS